MEPGFIWNDVHSNEHNIKVIALPPITSVDERVEKTVLPGRNGYLTQTDGTYEGEFKNVEFDYRGCNIDILKSWLKGIGKVMFSNEPDRYYKARIINKITLDQIVDILHTGLVQFDCQPFGYLLDGKKTITIDTETDILNLGNFFSEPYLKVYGSGDIRLNVNSQSNIIKNVKDYVEINTELDEVYRGTVSWENNSSGDTPVLEEGVNKISWIGNVSKIEIIPNWRCR